MRIIGNDPSTPRQAQIVASGTLPSGVPVVVNSDGTVRSAASQTVSGSSGSETQWGSSVVGATVVASNTNSSELVVVYADYSNSGYATAVVGTINGTSITFGTPSVFISAETVQYNLAYDSGSDKYIVTNTIYPSSGSQVRVGTVSGTSISFGTGVSISSDSINGAVYDPVNDKTVILTRATPVEARVGTVSGTSISLGSAVAINASSGTGICSPVYDSANGKIVIGYQDNGNSNAGTAVVGEVSGTSISFGTPVVFDANSGGTQYVGNNVVYDSNAQRVVIVYRQSSATRAIVGSVLGDSISFGTRVDVSTGSDINYSSLSFDSAVNKVVFAWRYDYPYDYRFIEGVVDDTTISFGSATVISSTNTAASGVNLNGVFDSTSGQTAFFYNLSNDSVRYKIYTIAGTVQYLTAENYIGTAATGAPNGTRAKINLKGAVADVPASAYDLANASYDSVSFSVNAPALSPRETMFNADGTKMYVLDNGNDSVYQFSLSTGFDLSTASYDSVSFSVTSQASNPQGFSFNNDGTKMYVVGEDNDTVYQYSLSTGFDLSTTSYDSVSFSVASQEATPAAVVFNTDGTKMYICGEISDAVHQYSLSTGFDLSTASYDSVSFDFSSQATIVLSMAFNGDGTKMFLSDAATDTIYQYGLSTAFNVSTASYDSVSFDVSSQDGNPHGIVFSAAGDKLYVTGWSTDTVYQYSTSASLTAGQSYYVQTDGTLGTTPADPSVFAGTAVAANKLIVKG